jgi:hypothetical protein
MAWFMQGTQIWNMPIRTTLPLKSDNATCFPSMDFKENSGACSPGEGAPEKAGTTARTMKINDSNIFLICTPFHGLFY